MATERIQVTSDCGTGRPFIIVFENGPYEAFANQVAHSLAQRTRVLMVMVPQVQSENWSRISSDFFELIQKQGIRQASFISLGSASVVVQNLCLHDMRVVRALVLVDATSRPHPTFYSRTLDKIERLLPLGLPFRQRQRGFDAMPYLQRLRCPVLVVSTDAASDYVRAQASVLDAKLPTSWLFTVTGEHQAESLAEAVVDFQEVPARCPQKNLYSA